MKPLHSDGEVEYLYTVMKQRVYLCSRYKLYALNIYFKLFNIASATRKELAYIVQVKGTEPPVGIKLPSVT